MGKSKITQQWKPVALDGALFTEGYGDLIGIEECTDYELNLNENKKRKIDACEKTNKPSTKKKRSKVPNKGVNRENDLSPSKSGSTLNSDNLDQEAVDEDVENDSMQAWREYNIPPVILKGIKEQGFYHPTQIQSLTFPPAILGKKDILGAAATGSGKTLAFGIPILTAIVKMKEELKNKNEHPLYSLILTPTRELAMQVKNHLENVAKYSDINIVAVVGGMAAAKQIRLLNKYPEIVIATPGRLWELIQLGYDHLTRVNKIRFLVLDETDRMLEKGHFQDLQNLLEKINVDEEAKKLRQNFVFSATLTLVHELPRYLKKKLGKSKKISQLTPEQKLGQIINKIGIKNPKCVDITEGVGLSDTLTESRVNCSITDKDYYVYYFLQKHPGKTIIFCNSISCVKRLATLLKLLDCKVLPLHASMQQRQRLKNLDNFRDRENSVLVATDVAARGLDIPCVQHVLHYQVPRTSECYVHRSGRTARANEQGLALLLIDSSELQNYIKVCKTLNKSEDIPPFPIQQNYLEAVKQRVNLARELDKLELQVRRTNSEAGWFNKAAKEMDIIVDHMSRKYDSEDGSKCQKLADLKRKQLSSLLNEPIFPKGISGNYPLTYGDFTWSPSQFKENAIDVMKNSLQKSDLKKRKKIYQFNPKKKYNIGIR